MQLILEPENPSIKINENMAELEQAALNEKPLVNGATKNIPDLNVDAESNGVCDKDYLMKQNFSSESAKIDNHKENVEATATDKEVEGLAETEGENNTSEEAAVAMKEVEKPAKIEVVNNVSEEVTATENEIEKLEETEGGNNIFKEAAASENEVEELAKIEGDNAVEKQDNHDNASINIKEPVAEHLSHDIRKLEDSALLINTHNNLDERMAERIQECDADVLLDKINKTEECPLPENDSLCLEETEKHATLEQVIENNEAVTVDVDPSDISKDDCEDSNKSQFDKNKIMGEGKENLPESTHNSPEAMDVDNTGSIVTDGINGDFAQSISNIVDTVVQNFDDNVADDVLDKMDVDNNENTLQEEGKISSEKCDKDEQESKITDISNSFEENNKQIEMVEEPSFEATQDKVSDNLPVSKYEKSDKLDDDLINNLEENNENIKGNNQSHIDAEHNDAIDSAHGIKNDKINKPGVEDNHEKKESNEEPGEFDDNTSSIKNNKENEPDTTKISIEIPPAETMPQVVGEKEAP